MNIYVKIGTHPAMWATTPKRIAPRVGEVFKIREQSDAKLAQVRCDKICEVDYMLLYFVERW